MFRVQSHCRGQSNKLVWSDFHVTIMQPWVNSSRHIIHEPLYPPPHSPPPQPFSASLLREDNFSLLRTVICMMSFAKIILNLWLPHLNKNIRSWLRPNCLEDPKDTPIKACPHIEGSSQKVSHFTGFCVVGWFKFECLNMKRHWSGFPVTWHPKNSVSLQDLLDLVDFLVSTLLKGLLRPY